MRSSPLFVPTLVTTGDLAALLGAWWLTGVIAPPGFTPVLLIPLAILHQLVLSTGSLHTQLRFLGCVDLLRRVVGAWVRVAGALCVIACLWPERVPPAGAVGFGIAFLMTLGAVRFGSTMLRRFVRQRGRNLRYVVIAGAGEAAMRARRHCTADPGFGLRVLGHLVRTDASEAELATVPKDQRLGTYDELEAVLKHHVIDELVFADPRCSFETMAALIEKARSLGLRTHVAAEFLSAWRGVDVQQWHGDVVLRLTPYPHDVFGLTVKRAVDLLAAALALVVLAPLGLALAIAVKLDSPGPVLFGQWRVGLNGRRFWFPKFRSMHRDAEARLQELRAHNEMTGPVFKLRDDPRITRVGRFLRRYSLDELPQLWCVLRGDMSLVGPRPLMPHEVAGQQGWQRRRLSVRPGLTCLWQISGRNDIDYERWMQLDLQYIDSWSLWLDLRILARTVPAVLSGRGAC